MLNNVRGIAGFVLAVTASMGLSACGGGGGGKTTPVATVAPAKPAPTVRVAGGRSLSVKYPRSTAIISSRSSGISSVTTTAVTATASLPGVPVIGPVLRDATIPLASSLQIFDNAAQTDFVLASRQAGVDTLTNASYGLVGSESATTGSLGVYHQGTYTTAAQLPSNLTAVYNGSFIGSKVRPGNGLSLLNGDSTIVANFGAGTVAGRISNIKEGIGIPEAYDIKMNGTISGNTYAGTAKFVHKGGSAAVGVVNRSTMNGGFYGAAAAETAGVLRVEGKTLAPIGRTLQSAAIIGAFGGKKQ